jgi:hypothetical protein
VVAAIAATLVLQEMAARLGAVGRTGLGEALRASIRQPVLRATHTGLALVAITFGNAAYQAGNLTGAALGIEAGDGGPAGLGGRPQEPALPVGVGRDHRRLPALGDESWGNHGRGPQWLAR